MNTHALKTFAAGLVIAVAGLATVGPAAADSFSFGVQIGDTGIRIDDDGIRAVTDRHGRHDRWDRWDRYDGHDRRDWRRHGHAYQVCEPVWHKRVIRNRWGHVVEVQRYKTVECHWVRR